MFAGRASSKWAKIYWTGTKRLLSPLEHIKNKRQVRISNSWIHLTRYRARYVTLSLVLANLYIMEDIFKLVFINFRVTLLLSYFCTMNFWGVLTWELTKMPKVDCCLPPAMYTEHCSTTGVSQRTLLLLGLCFLHGWVFQPSESHQFASRMEFVMKVFVPDFVHSILPLVRMRKLSK